VSHAHNSIAASFAPRPHRDVVAAEVDDEVVLYDTVAAAIHILNSSASAVWFMLDGTATLGDIATDVADVCGIPYDAALSDVIGAVRSMADQQLLDGFKTASEPTRARDDVTTPRYSEVPPNN
jgi:hypothetical protein